MTIFDMVSAEAARERAMLFALLGKSDDGRQEAEMTRAEFEAFKRGKKVTNHKYTGYRSRLVYVYSTQVSEFFYSESDDTIFAVKYM